MTEDRFLLIGGESIGGTVVAAPRLGRFAMEEAKPGSETFQIVRRSGMQPISVPAGKVMAVQFGVASEGTAGQASSGTRRDSGGALVWMGLTGGSIVQASSVRVRGDSVTMALAGGGELKTTLAGRDEPAKRFWDAVTYLEPVGSRVTWLSHREALGYKQIPFLSVKQPLGIDQSVLGTRLRADGAVFRKGIGMPSASRVAYDVAVYRKFEAEIAIDKTAGLAGSVVFKVVLQAGGGEWRAAYESPLVRGGDATIPISVELKGASRMALLVEFAERGDECDYADWLAARLVK
ncbi:MAG: NPCBM/NEW2 domain-containing protein [Planctomycetia bacterium]|nr:NPCBM/NEW2 domain-containing protein [Planctomycetia bacterium]